MKYDQAENLRRKAGAFRHSREAKTIAIASGKGGAGKSNIAVNFSLALRRQQKKVLLFDLDFGMGNLDVLLGLNTETTIVDMFTNYLSVHDIINDGPHGLEYVAAGSGLNHILTLEEDQRNFFFRQYETLTHLYDYIIFDMGAGATHEMLSFVMASDECIIVTTTEPTSITDAYGMIKHILKNNPDLPVSVIMNRADSVKSGELALERFRRVIEQFLHTEIRKLGILPEDKAVSTAVMRQMPFLLLNENASVSKALNNIIANYLKATSMAESSTSVTFVQKLKKLMLER